MWMCRGKGGLLSVLPAAALRASPRSVPRAVGTRGGERSLLVLRGFVCPGSAAARSTSPPGWSAVPLRSRSPAFGMRRGLHHMAGGTETFLQGKIIASQPPPHLQ